MKSNPYLIEFSSKGSLEIGYISILQGQDEIPFKIKRVFWAYYTPDSVVRGRHAHHETEMVLIAVAGRIILTTEMPGEKPEVFILEKPTHGVYMPKLCWHTMQYSHNAVQVVLVSTIYNERDYIRDYEEFLKFGK
ncbi:WxcM-like domain-containing protein [Hanamia caeni]|jgi:dTDP-4-dehydrorhamnose 3,5-epimerase-like enzyme|uniref:WxcM-like domain-containing protein n=1 Tax=Hanamia caeni TaxID=2294116 RepID=A0A3M9N462_9BACT|nr:FdtA/QdtA family cupin domain-containing protein [Hanamia caeni]RNI32195.1 WxcM-like domain-containing protein [Hanamia caeni]